MVSLRNDFKIPHGISIVKQEREIICKKASGSYQSESVTSEMNALRPVVAALLGKLAYARHPFTYRERKIENRDSGLFLLRRGGMRTVITGGGKI